MIKTDPCDELFANNPHLAIFLRACDTMMIRFKDPVGPHMSAHRMAKPFKSMMFLAHFAEELGILLT